MIRSEGKLTMKKLNLEDKKNIKDKFQKAYKSALADTTFEIYFLRLKQILDGNIERSSKSKDLQYKAVLSKLKEIGIELNLKLPRWTRRGNNIKKNVIDSCITEKQLQAILRACPGSKKGEELRKAIQISYYSGLRLEEVLGLNPEDIKVNGDGMVKLRVSGKGDKYRSAYLPREQIKLVEGFPGFSINSRYIKTNMQRIREKIGLNVSFHKLRHSFASNILNAGGNIKLLQELLGHSNLATTSVYLHTVDRAEQLQGLGF